MKLKAETSNRHVHLCSEDFKLLFGEDKQLTVKKMLGKEEFAANETLRVSGPKGSIEEVRVLGPYRKATQVEMLWADCRKTGVEAPLAESVSKCQAGDVTLTGPAGSIQRKAAIIAHRHVHLNEQIGREQYQLEEGQMIKVRVPGPRAVTFENVLVRMHKGPVCVVHLDVEEGNSAGLKSGDEVELIVD